MTAFDAPVATRVRRSAARAARTAFPAASSKATARTTQGAFHRRVPRSTDPLARPDLERETRHRSRDFAAPVRLPALLRPPLPREEGLDPAASGRSSRPGAPGHAPLVDFCNRNDPQARPWTYETPPASRAARLAALPISGAGPARGKTSGFSRRRSAVREPRIHGSGAVGERVGFRRWFPLRLPPTALARDESFAPTRSTLEHLLSHRPMAPRLESPRRCSNGPRAASRTPSRKENAFRRTRGAFLRRTSLPGGAFSTACHQPVEWCPRLCNLRAWPRTDGATGVRRLVLVTTSDGLTSAGRGAHSRKNGNP
jgi:hypothetical protein